MSQQINLFNPIFLKQKKILSALTMAQALGLILLGALLLSAYVILRSAALNSQIEAAAKQLQVAQGQVNQMNALLLPKQKNRELEDDIRSRETELIGLRQAATTLQSQEFGNRSGYSEYLRAFARQIGDGIWLTGFTLRGAGSGIELQGRALRPELVAAYLGRLNQEEILRGKSFETLEMDVPLIEQPSRADPAIKQRLPAAYLAFNLQSSASVAKK